MHIVVAVVLVIFSWKLKVLGRIASYRETMLYIAACDLLYHFLCSSYPLWIYHPDAWLPNAALTNLLYAFIFLPLTALLFLGLYPKPPASLLKQALYLSVWIAGYMVWEWQFTRFRLITYDNDWTLAWSLLFYAVMFPMLLLHHRKPVWAYPLSLAAVVFWMLLFQVSLQ